MTTMVEKKFAVEIAYNGVTKQVQVESEEQVTALLRKAIETFHVTQNAHLLSLFRQDGTLVAENESIEKAGLKPHELLLLRPNSVKGGAGLLLLAKDLLRRSFCIFQECGRGECECAVYWTGPAANNVIYACEH